uniref:Uncharacterized protein n=1 Tax=Arundo donax TaxID=35708 RepID=A0A0A9DM12_ARUDO
MLLDVSLIHRALFVDLCEKLLSVCCSIVAACDRLSPSCGSRRGYLPTCCLVERAECV